MIAVPISNPIKFRPVTGQTDVNFDNQMSELYNGMTKPFSQLVAEDEWHVQVVTDTYYGEGVTCTLGVCEYDSGWVWSTFESVNQIDGLYRYTFLITPTLTGCFKLYVITNVADTPVIYHESEWLLNMVDVDAYRLANPDIFKLEWFNTENAFQAEYAISGFVAKAFIQAKLTYQGMAGDAVIFDNQGDDVKLKATVQRLMKFECEVPDYLAEIIGVGMDHDSFFINDVEYITSKKPTFTQLGRSNAYKFEAELKQAAVIGLNTHDTGFNCDAPNFNNMILNDTQIGKTASFTVEAPADYLLHMITVIWGSGTATIACGTTAGGSDIFPAETIAIAEPTVIEVNYALESATTLYFTIVGTVLMDVNLQYILNRER